MEGNGVSETPVKNEHEDDKSHKKSAHRRKKKAQHNHQWLVWVALLILVALAYQFGWKNINEFHARFKGMEAAMQGIRDNTRTQLGEYKTSINDINERQTHLENGLDEWLSNNSHLRKDWLLAEAEYLIKLASHRLLLEQDVKTAIVAMEGANARLAEVGDPSLLKVRKQINKDIQKLKSVPNIDVAGISLTLSGLIQSVSKLPLQVPDPDSIRERIKERGTEQRVIEGWKGFLIALWQDLKNLVVIRNHEQPIQSMLTTDQQFFLVQNLQLRLEQARLALLQGETGVYQERLKEIEKSVPKYFDVTHELTRSTVDTVSKLLKQDITPELPELTRSYEKLEKYLNSSSTYKPRKKQKSKKKAEKKVDKPKEKKSQTEPKTEEKSEPSTKQAPKKAPVEAKPRVEI